MKPEHQINTPKISVIMAVYNSSKYLSQTIESVLNQTFKDFELIIIDDKSTDNSLDIVKKYASSDQRITYICNEQNSGPAKSRNKGLKIAKGKCIAILDSSDIFLPDRLKMQYEFLENNPDFYLVGAGAVDINENGTETTVERPITDEKKLKQKLPKVCKLVHSTTMFRNTRTFFYREKFAYAHDYDLFLNILSQNKKITCLPDILVKYRVLPGSISFSKKIQQYLFAEKVREFYDQRRRTGKDEYDNFDPLEVTQIDIGEIRDKKLMGYQIEAYFKVNAFDKVRELYMRYIKYHKMLDKYIVYYLVSFLPQALIDLLRRIIWR